MAVGLGARTSNMDSRYYVNAQENPANFATRSVSTPGQILQAFPGMGGNADNATNLDATSLLVWVITIAAIGVVLGVHASFGGNKLF